MTGKNEKRSNGNLKSALICVSVFCLMFGLAYAFVPLYNLFCKSLGIDGTTQVATAAPDKILDRKIKVVFTATTDKNLPWTFEPMQKSMTVRIGETGLAYYRAKNLSDKPVTGMAVYNVQPDKTGVYFNKIHCFCFDTQTLQPGQAVEMPLTFFIDPKMDQDKNADDIKEIALSYIFYAQ